MTDRRTEEYSAAREVWRKFRGSRTAMTGLLLILLLCAVAVFAPLIANGKPLLVLMDGSLSSPAFRAMTAPESSELFVEKTFNYLMLFPHCGGAARRPASDPLPDARTANRQNTMAGNRGDNEKAGFRTVRAGTLRAL